MTRPLVEIPKDHTILSVPTSPCVHSSGMWKLVKSFRDWLSPIGFHYGCVVNELVSLHNRHLIRKTDPNPASVAMVARWWKRLLPDVKTSEWSPKKVLDNTPAHRKRRVEKAFSDLDLYGLRKKDTKVRAFIKHEKGADIASDSLAGKDPRLIQYRSFKFTARLQQFLMPMEHRIFKWGQSLERATQIKDRLFSKGMNSWQIGSWISENWDSYKYPRADLWDVSRFDAHMGKAVREGLEFAVYRKMNPAISELLESMKRNDCYTKSGIHYRTSYTMCSGEACTSLGDSIVMAAVLKYVYRNCNARILVNGDDSVVICDQDAKPDVAAFGECGLPIKHEQAYMKEHVEFCQCRPVKIQQRWRMVRNPERVLSRSTHTLKNFTGVSPYADWLSSVGTGELACNDGVPVLQQWSIYLKAHGAMRKHFVSEVMMRRPGEKMSGPAPIDTDARISFALAWGIMPDYQRDLERELMGLTTGVVPGDRKSVV